MTYVSFHLLHLRLLCPEFDSYKNGPRSNVHSLRGIVQDCKKALFAFGLVYEHGGGMVPGLANRNGHRNLAAGRNTDGWGGARIKIYWWQRLVDGYTQMH